MTHAVLPSMQIAKLERLVHTERTGLLTLSFGAERAVLCLENGQIGSLFYNGAKGLAALSLLCDDLSAHDGIVRLQFDSVPVSGNDPFLPLTETVLNRFKGRGQHVTQTDVTTENGQLAPIPGVLLTDTLKAILQVTLEKVVGPVSQTICEEVFKTTRTLRVAVEALASELPDPALAQTFRDSVRAQTAALAANEFSFGADELSKAEVSASAKGGIELTEPIRQMIADVLPLFVGQHAAPMCSEVFAQTTSLRAAIDHLTAQMSNPASAGQFKDVVRKRLATLDDADDTARAAS